MESLMHVWQHRFKHVFECCVLAGLNPDLINVGMSERHLLRRTKRAVGETKNDPSIFRYDPLVKIHLQSVLARLTLGRNSRLN